MNVTLRNAFAPARRMAWLNVCIYACFFLSGATSLVYEVLWSREFVTVFGNSSYAISIVLCAYMAGLGLGGLAGGRLADGMKRRTMFFGGFQALIAVWALAVPFLLARLRGMTPDLSAWLSDSLLVSTLIRFTLSFAILLVPCFLMGATFPLLARAVTRSDQLIGRRIGALYCWNTLGAAFGCLAAGFWMIDTLGLRLTNLTAVGVNVAVAVAAFALSGPIGRAAALEPAGATPSEATGQAKPPEPLELKQTTALVLLVVGFLNGMVSLTCEVLWVRYLLFLSTKAYVFPTILCVFLLGLGLGGLVYSVLQRRVGLSIRALGIIEMALGVSVLATFVGSAFIFASGPPEPVSVKGMALLTVFVPTVLMGAAFPLLCSVYGRHVASLGRRVGLLFALNTAGAVMGSLLPIFVLVPWIGIQRSLLLASLVYGGMGLALLVCERPTTNRLIPTAAVVYGGTLLIFLAAVPANLCQRVFLAKDFVLAMNTDIFYYQEGRTGTATLVRDRVDDCKTLWLNGNSEVPLGYSDVLCFKMLGDLGPMLQAKPDDVLMICFGGGIAAGTTTLMPEVKSLTIVDMESCMVRAAELFSKENNGVLQNPKAHVVIDDGRNYILTAPRKWPVIISDSTHPKSADSWVLYTREFYQLVHDHLTTNGVFVEWLPRHGLTTAEYKIIVRTFLSVFPHTSLWVTQGMDAEGSCVPYTLLVGTSQPLSIDVTQLGARLREEPVRRDLERYGLDTPAGFLDSFLCSEITLRHWVGEGPVNTDNLPYTQYETRYSKGVKNDPAEFIEPMEDIWPCLTNLGSEQSAEQLHKELELRARANRLSLLGRWQQAYAVLPQDVRYREMRRLYDEQGPRYRQALLKLYWNDPNALVSLMAPMAAGPPDPAGLELIAKRAMELDPDNVAALNYLASVDIVDGNVTEADDYLRRALRRDPRSENTLNNLAVLLEGTGRHTEALEDWHKAALVSNSPKAVDMWGFCLAHEGRMDEAARWMERAISLQPAYIPAQLHLALLLIVTGQGAEAIPHLRYVLKMDPENQDARQMLAKVRGP
ncbi:MAG: fused MFS/spermidine synthase [Verrucomicrobiia bacterium]